MPSAMPSAEIDRLWDYSDPAKSERAFRDYLETLVTGDQRDARLQVLTQIARAQGLQRRFDDAHRTLDEVTAELANASSRVQVRYLLERGRVHNSAGAPPTARPLFEDAWNKASQAGLESLAIDAAHMMAIASDGEEAITWNRRALARAEIASDPQARKWMGSLYNNLGWTYHDRGDFTTALDLFERALEFRKTQGVVGPLRVAQWCVARTLRSLGRTTEALGIQQALEREHSADGGRDGYVFEELGECLLAMGRADEAQNWFAKAYDELAADPWFCAHEAPRLARLKELGKK